MSDDGELTPANFTEEKNLWQIYRKSRKVPTNKFNFVTTSLIFIASILAVLFYSGPVGGLAKFVRETAALGFATTLSVLGFLVAGFTIFATISNPDMLIAMGGKRHDCGLSWLKYSFFVLIRVFVYFLVYAFICFFVIYFGSSGGLVSSVVSSFCEEELIKKVVVSAASVVMITGQYFLLMQLKSFIFNVYHAVVGALRWKAEGH